MHQRKKNNIIGEDGQLLIDPDQPPARSTAVLGRAVLEEVWADRERLELPSYITSGPNKLGITKTKITADKRRSISTIHLVITLVRIWSYDDARKKEMLENYMHLVSALHIASMRNTSETHIDLYTYHYKEYLRGRLKLYKEVQLMPNHHLCLHLEIFLRLFGPVHSWRAWVFERFNYLMQNVKTNSKFGGNVYD